MRSAANKGNESDPGKTQPAADPAEFEKVVVATISPEPAFPSSWPTPGYHAGHYVKAGFWLGSLAGCTSLLFNVVGSVLWPAISGQAQHPLRIIQVYLTVPWGEAALHLDGGILLAVGCVFYLATGMLYGMLFEWSISYLIPNSGLWGRILYCSGLALVVWGVNFYAVLIWLQPLLFGHRWIVDLIPWWVAALTHLVFGWTMALVYPVGINERNRSTR